MSTKPKINRGRGRAIDETGNVYGRLTVIGIGAYKTRRDGRRDYRLSWLCQCECGSKVSIISASLRSGNSTSCGCLRRENFKSLTLPEGEGAFNRAYDVMRRNAKTRGLPWDLSKSEVRLLVSRNCYYCGAPPSNLSKGRFGNYKYSGIDRVDSSSGYIIGNVAACCFLCNNAKGRLTLVEFKAWANRLSYHLNKEQDLGAAV